MSWLGRLKEGLRKSSSKLVDGIGRALNLGRLDAASLDALEEALIEADLGPAVAALLVERVRARKLPADTPSIEVRPAPGSARPKPRPPLALTPQLANPPPRSN